MLKKIAPHVTLICGIMTLVFFVISRFNDAMAFMTSSISQWFFAFLAVSAVVTSVCFIVEDVKAEQRRERRAAAKRAQQEADRRARKAHPLPKED